MPVPRWSLALFASLPLAAAPLTADPLAELRSRLEALHPQQTVRARIELVSRSESSEDEQPAVSSETVIVELGPTGLRMEWTPAQLAAARDAEWRRQRDPDAPQSDATLGELPAWDAARLLDSSASLRLAIDGATLVENRADQLDGAPARLLVIRPRSSLSKTDKTTKRYDDTLMLWLDADGYPLAADRKVEARGSKFLISFGFSEHVTRRYSHIGEHLVVTRQTRESSSEGLGMKGRTTQTSTVTVLP